MVLMMLAPRMRTYALPQTNLCYQQLARARWQLAPQIALQVRLDHLWVEFGWVGVGWVGGSSSFGFRADRVLFCSWVMSVWKHRFS